MEIYIMSLMQIVYKINICYTLIITNSKQMILSLQLIRFENKLYLFQYLS